jgi:hypothetical protein
LTPTIPTPSCSYTAVSSTSAPGTLRGFDSRRLHSCCRFHNVLWIVVRRKGEEAPLLRNALELMVAAVFEPET